MDTAQLARMFFTGRNPQVFYWVKCVSSQSMLQLVVCLRAPLLSCSSDPNPLKFVHERVFPYPQPCLHDCQLLVWVKCSYPWGKVMALRWGIKTKKRKRRFIWGESEQATERLWSKSEDWKYLSQCYYCVPLKMHYAYYMTHYS